MGKLFTATALLIFVWPLLLHSQDPPENSVNSFLFDYYRRGAILDEPTGLPYLEGSADLNGDGRAEVLIYPMDLRMCGSGGCNLVILSPEGSSYRLVADIPTIQLPIGVLGSESNGWRSVAANNQKLEFDGSIYRKRGLLDRQTATRDVITDQRIENQKRLSGTSRQTALSSSPSATPEAVLLRFLQDYVRREYFLGYLKGGDAKDLPNGGFLHSFYDLNGDGQNEAIVYLTGPSWWNATLVLSPDGPSYMVVADVPVGTPPIRVSPNNTLEWQNLVLGPDELEIPFIGRFYDRTFARTFPGRIDDAAVLIPEPANGDIGTPLFPNGL